MLRNASYRKTDDQQTVDYNDDVHIDEHETIDYNNDTNVTDLNGTNRMDLKKTYLAQLVGKNIIRKYKNLKRKGAPVKIPAKKGKEEDVIFIRQKMFHSRDRLKRLTNLRKKNEEVKFLRKVPLHPRDRLKRLTNTKKQVQDVKFIKKVPLHPREKLKRKTTELYNYSELAKKSRNDDAVFIK